MIQFNDDDIARLLRGVRCYQDKYRFRVSLLIEERLADKLQNYQEQIATD